MSWLYSVILAGLMFSTGSDVSLSGKQYNLETETNSAQTIQLDETEKFEQSYALNANGKVYVANVNGSITVEAWDKNEVKLEAVKIGDSRESLDEVEIKVDSNPNSFRVETEYLNRRVEGEKGWKNYRKLEVQFRLIVPRTAILDEIETVNGSVTVSNFVNSTNVSAVNGQVKATNLRGNASLSTVNGTVNADFDSLESGSKISLETVNGQVNLLIPSDTNATVKADTVNGRIANDFGLPVRKGEYVGKDLYGRLGSGNAQIKLSSVNGGLFINRKNDGKNPSQPTNLLNDIKNSSDDEDSADNAFPAPPRPPKVKVGKINKEVSAALKEAEKERLVSMKEAQKEMEEALKEMRLEMKDVDPEIALAAEASVRAALESVKDLKEINIEDLQKQIESIKLDKFAKLGRLAEINWSGSMPSIEKKSETFAVKGTPKVTVNAQNCDVKIRGWDRQEVQYVIKKLSRNREKQPISMTADAGESEVKIVVNNKEEADEYFGDGAKGVYVEVFVPKKSNLKIVTDGEIRIESVSGELELNGTQGAINIRDAEGKLRLFTADGLVRIIGFRGELEAQTNDSEVFLEGDFTKINARSAAGDIYLTLPETANALIKTNGEIGFTEKCAGCVGFVMEDENTWRTGKGDSKYNFTSESGRLYLRNSNVVSKK